MKEILKDIFYYIIMVITTNVYFIVSPFAYLYDWWREKKTL